LKSWKGEIRNMNDLITELRKIRKMIAKRMHTLMFENSIPAEMKKLCIERDIWKRMRDIMKGDEELQKLQKKEKEILKEIRNGRGRIC